MEAMDPAEAVPPPLPAPPTPLRLEPVALTAPPYPVRRRRWLLPLLLFLATCLTTFLAGGPIYAAALMGILLAHELGHFLQAVRYRVPASLPHFIPMPLPPIGTLGAVIGMRGQVANPRQLFDVAVSGPLAGLVPALVCSVLGLRLSEVVPRPENIPYLLGHPLLFQWLRDLLVGPVPEGHVVLLHPLAYAGWVGIFITGLNLLPIGQLDGGHLLYTLIRRRAHTVSLVVLAGAAVAIVVAGLWQWTLLVAVLLLFGVRHPPTADDGMPLGEGRVLLGWLTLALFLLCFTPEPLRFLE